MTDNNDLLMKLVNACREGVDKNGRDTDRSTPTRRCITA